MNAPRTLLCLAALLSASSAHAAVGVVDAALKVRPSDKPQLAASAHLKAARNEFAPFQLVIDGAASSVSATASDLTGPSGTIPAKHVRLYREAYLNVTTVSNVEGATGRWPDALIPDVDEVFAEKRKAFPFDVPSGENRVLFVDLFVPPSTPPGEYSGEVKVSSSSGTISVPVALTVLHFTLPSTSTLASTFGMGWNAACVAHFGSYEACGYDAGIIQMNTRYAKFMLDHRITAEVVYTGPKSSTGGYDWAKTFDNYYAPLFDGTATDRLLSDAKYTSIRYTWSGAQDRYKAWADHFRAKGWLSRTYDYTCDEPPATCAWSDIPARAANVHGADPELRTLVTTNIVEAQQHGVDDDIDILVPVVNHMDDKADFGGPFVGNQRAKYDAFLKSGPRKTLWWYQSCMSHGCGGPGGAYFSQWPSYMVDVSGVQNRAMEWLTYKYDVSGELYFETTFRLADAWNSVYAFGGNGDGTLLYPGKPSVIGGMTDIPVASYRLKMIREGMEDYEVLHALDTLGERTFAKGVVNALFPSAHDANQPAQKLAEARELILYKLDELTAPPPAPTEHTPIAAASGTISIDGDLSEFTNAAPVTLDAAGAEIRMLWDATALYVGFRVEDAAQLINEGGRDGEVWDGDGVEVMLDTLANRALAPDADDYHVCVNAKGDLRDERGGASPWDLSWTSGAEYVVKPDASGYTVEAAIPWAALGVQPQEGASFGMDLAVNDSDVAGSVTPFDWAKLTRFAQPSKWMPVTLQAPLQTGSAETPSQDTQPPAQPEPSQSNVSVTPSTDGDAHVTMGCAAVPADGAWWGAALVLAATICRRRLLSSVNRPRA